jgi:hypothetical protein
VRRDLTTIGESNRPLRETEADGVVTADPTGRLATFRRFVDDSHWSTNVDAEKVVQFDRAGEVLDARRLCVARCHGDAHRGLREFEFIQGPFLARRKAFEQMWENGESLIYGAVNAGGAGTGNSYTGFGAFCLVLNDPSIGGRPALAVFPGDTVQLYTNGVGALHEAAACAGATSWDGRAAVALLALQATLPGCEPGDWPELVCSIHAYLEAPRAGDLPVNALSEIRLTAGAATLLTELTGRSIVGERLEEHERALVSAYQTLRGLRSRFGIPITVLLTASSQIR